MSKADKMRAYALSKVGLPYQLGEEFDHNAGPTLTPREDGDCSGLVFAAYTEAKVLINGRPLGRETADTYYRMATPIGPPAKVGDQGYLLRNGHCYHTFLYVGNGQVVEAGDGTGHVGLRTVAQENRRGCKWGRFAGNDIGELEGDDMDEATVRRIVREELATEEATTTTAEVAQATAYLDRLGILSASHDGGKVPEMKLLRVALARLAKMAGVT
jgi:hypothetical protein